MSLRLVSTIVLFIATFLYLEGCGEAPKPERSVQNGDTTRRFADSLPSGRFQIPTRHTPVPDFYITLPEGYRIKDDSRFPDDKFYFIRNDDPGISDRSAVTPGFMLLYVGVNAMSALSNSVVSEDQNVVIASRPLVWKKWSEKLPDGSPYYLREITSSDFFASLSEELAHAPLHLQIYIAGRDSARVSELMTAARSLSLHP